MENIFITTTLPYINSAPHMGHAFEFIFGDVIARYLRRNNEVVFNIGLDEHGLKVFEKAMELGITPEEHVENMTAVWIEFCERFNIEYDIFYKTSDKSHHDKVKTIWNLMVYSGDIYKKHYNGQYCKGCESYKTSKDLVDGHCPDHNLPGFLIEIEEENYFFKLTNYKQAIRNYIKDTPDFLLPQEKRTELLNLALDAEDISISRLKENCPWGVDVPGDQNQVIYVWFDALLNYIFAAGYLTPLFKWENVIQICGPDNLRFQGVIFQAFLKALKIPFTNTLLVHGTILDNAGKKMSKSIGNTVDPIQQLEKYGIDAVRYYAVAGIQNYSNSAWNEKDLVNRFNSEVCDDWGNLVSRALHLYGTKCGTEIDERPEVGWLVHMQSYERQINYHWKNFQLNEAFAVMNEVVKECNAHINDNKPWALGEKECADVVCNVLYFIRILNEFYKPVFPSQYEVIKQGIIDKKKVIAFTKLK